jgi:hypothetical protein
MPNARDAKVQDSSGHYPKWRNRVIPGTLENEIHIKYLVDRLFEVFHKEKKKSGSKKDILNRIYEYLERVEGYYYGISVGFYNSNSQDKMNGTTEHAVPAKMLLSIFQKLINNKMISSPDDLLKLIKRNYFK